MGGAAPASVDGIVRRHRWSPRPRRATPGAAASWETCGMAGKIVALIALGTLVAGCEPMGGMGMGMGSVAGSGGMGMGGMGSGAGLGGPLGMSPGPGGGGGMGGMNMNIDIIKKRRNALHLFTTHSRHRSLIRPTAILANFNLLHEVSLIIIIIETVFRTRYDITHIIRTGEILGRERIVKEIAKGIIQYTVLRIAVVAK